MIRVSDLPEEAARIAIDSGEFPPTITGGARVAVVMTQNWCPDWLIMKSWLRRLERSDDPAVPDIDVHVLVYNTVPFFHEFMQHKEQVFGNHLIPYVRCYRGGRLVAEKNRMGPKRFLEIFA